jgi:molybdopterin-binding protein
MVDVGGCQIEAVSAVGPGRAVLCCLRPEDVTLWSGVVGASPAGEVSGPVSGSPGTSATGSLPRVVSSARNQLPGDVSRMVAQGSLVRVTIDCGIPLVASITRASAEEMGLVPGGRVLVTFKATAVHLIPLAG